LENFESEAAVIQDALLDVSNKDNKCRFRVKRVDIKCLRIQSEEMDYDSEKVRIAEKDRDKDFGGKVRSGSELERGSERLSNMGEAGDRVVEKQFGSRNGKDANVNQNKGQLLQHEDRRNEDNANEDEQNHINHEDAQKLNHNVNEGEQKHNLGSSSSEEGPEETTLRSESFNFIQATARHTHSWIDVDAEMDLGYWRGFIEAKLNCGQ
jgi:hypothetical protein